MTNELMRNDFEAHLTRNVSGLCTYQTAISQHPNGDYVSKFSQERWIDWQAATLAAAPQWLPIADAPRGRKLLLGYSNKLGKWRTITGCYYLPQTLLLADDNDDLDEDEDGYAPEGWYEESESHDNILRTDEPHTHFQPLPLPPTATLQGKK